MVTRVTRLKAWVLVALVGTLAASATAAPAKRAVIISWDGAADWVVDRLLAEGQLPNVARLAKRGVRADHCMPAFPSKTACGHAALWTGAYGDVNGISGNSVPLLPRAEHTLLEQRSGFDAASLTAEPLWIPAAKAGKKVVILSATQSYPPDRWIAELQQSRVPEQRFLTFSGFESSIEPVKIWDGSDLKPAQGWSPLPAHRGTPREFSFSVGETVFHILVYDNPRDPVQGADTLLIRQGSKEEGRAAAASTLKPAEAADHIRHYSSRFRVTRGDLTGLTYFRLFSLAPDGRMVLLQRGVNGLRGAAPPEERARYLDAYGGFLSAPFREYEEGLLGKTLWQAGDGTAERRLLECIRLDVNFLRRGTRYALRQWKPELVFHYTPWTDSAGHTWMGVLDPESPRYDAAFAKKLWPFYVQVYLLQDEWLGEVLDQVDRETVVCLVSDHGMEGVGQRFAPNVALEKAGLLVRNSEGAIDLSRTRICVPPWGEYCLTLNGTDWKGGFVAPSEREEVLRAAEQALLAATDPTTGRRIVTGLFRPGQILGIGIGGPAGGDLYFDLLPGYVPTSQLASSIVERLPSPIGLGVHGFFPQRAKMQSICFMSGPGVAAGVQIPGMRQIDVAPTLARLLGIPPPKDSQGHVLGEMLRE
jgi:predicted AlkP superfamily pyrophosphatase or phosphodiesterase